MTACLTIILVVYTLSSFAQNLVPNPSFEEQKRCPIYPDIKTWDNLVFSEYPPDFWLNPTYSTPDYFSQCASGSIGIPENGIGFQFARTGNAYIGISPFVMGNGLVYNSSEYLQVKLISPLIIGAEYRISFWISLGDSSRLASNSLGLLLTLEQVTSQGQKMTAIPQLENHEIIRETENWLELSKIWIADSAVEWLTIGCFKNSSEVIYEKRPLSDIGSAYLFSYYYIDDVSIELIRLPQELPNIFTPNADGINDNWPGAILHDVPTIQIYDRWGRQVYTGSSNWDGRFEGLEAPEGVYFYVLTQANIERRSGTVTLLR